MALATYPKTDPADLPADAALTAQAQLEGSFVGTIGQAIQPAFAPLGFDWKTTVGVVTSFAAREVVVSTLTILYGLGDEAEQDSLLSAMRSSTRADGSPVFTTATCLSLLVFLRASDAVSAYPGGHLA